MMNTMWLVRRSAWVASLSLVVAFTKGASAQSVRLTGLGRVGAAQPTTDGSVKVAAAGAPSIKVSKTAYVDGQNVCGTIRITNAGEQSAIPSAVVDSLEVHFPLTVSPPALPAGSTPTWFKVADVPVALPGPIAPRGTATIDYCFSLCLAADSPGANSMRNVVAVTVMNEAGVAKTVTARSTSFSPPVLDCQACCRPDGSCTDTVLDDCAAVGGLSQGAGTDCATTECPQACCLPDDSCTYEGPSACQAAAGEPKGPGTDCASIQCCEPLGSRCSSGLDCCGENVSCDGTCCIRLADTGCATQSDCCDEDGFAICDAGRCCAPNRAPDSCHDATDCCDPNATCSAGACCISLGETGCTNLVGNDCCASFGAVICEAGKCCAPTGAPDSCFADTDCCDADATCNGGTCCVRLTDTGCADASDCCEDEGTVICDAGRCCAPNRAPDSCHDATDCCDENATCSSGTCCIALGDTGCTNLVGNDCCDSFGAVICEAGRCCAPTGADNSCTVDTDCCDVGATCNGGTCCVGTGELGCDDVSDCCDDRSGMACIADKCCAQTDAGFHSACDDATDCCDPIATCDIHGACCIAIGNTGCTSDSACCPELGATCNAGRCCTPNGDFCVDSTHCCGNAICSNSTCCIPQFRSGCLQDSDCCAGLFCSGGTCEAVIGP